jgi:hypothetical protein
VEQLHNRIEAEVANFSSFADNLAVNSAIRWDVHHQGGHQAGVATEPSAGLEGSTLRILGFGGGPGRNSFLVDRDPVLRECSIRDDHLAAPTKTVTTAHRGQIDSELPGCVEQRGTYGDVGLFPRRRKRDAGSGISHL